LPDDVISAPDLKIIYQLPLEMRKQKLDLRILTKLGLKKGKPDLDQWEKLVAKVKKIEQQTKKINIAIVGKYFATGKYQLRDSYVALIDAIKHAAWFNNINVNIKWVDAEKVEKEGINKFIDNTINGIIVPIGWGIRGTEGMIKASGYARNHKIPFLGLCYGMQLVVISFARDIIGWQDANTAENSKTTKHPVIHFIPSQKEIIKRRAYGGTMRLGAWQARVKKDTIAWNAYANYGGFLNKDQNLTSERHRHRLEFNNKYINDFAKKGMVISARSTIENLVEIIELPQTQHPFYLGTQGHPEYKSRPLKPHPIFIEFIKACIKKT